MRAPTRISMGWRVMSWNRIDGGVIRSRLRASA
jgi:hypothetical protein